MSGEGGYNPQKVIMTADYYMIWAVYMNEYDWYSQAGDPALTASRALRVFRHNGQSTVGFADGHVEYAVRTDTNYWGTYSLTYNGKPLRWDPKQVGSY